MCFSFCVHCGFCWLQFENHGFNLERTKQKLVEAANLVDKVTSDMKPKKTKNRQKVGFFCS